MTIQTKRFIELPDIVALRLECNDCGTTICVLVSKEVKVKTIHSCPNCQKPWLTLPTGSTIEPTVTKCIESIKETITALQSWEQQMKAADFPGFKLTLEIKSGEAPLGAQK